MKEREDNSNNPFGLSRREFLKWSSALGATALTVGGISEVIGSIESKTQPFVLADQIIRTGCPAHNCGGRCLLKVFVKDKKIIR